MPNYTDEHAKAGIDTKLPTLETWPNQFPGYVITTRFPEYSSVCPKTGLPDFGVITIQYKPRKACIELKSLKMYLLAYRNLGIFYENAVNKMLRDIVKATQSRMVRRQRRVHAPRRPEHFHLCPLARAPALHAGAARKQRGTRADQHWTCLAPAVDNSKVIANGHDNLF